MSLRRHNPKGGIILRRSPALLILDDTREYRLRTRALLARHSCRSDGGICGEI
jgi:hypothetical protein